MSIAEFTATIQSKIYKDWLKTLNANIVTKSAKEIRSSQQVASKTDFLITRETLKDMFQQLSGKNVNDTAVHEMLGELASPTGPKTKNALIGKFIKVNGQPAVLFENISFDSISAVMDRVLDNPLVYENLHKLSLQRQAENVARLQTSGKSFTNEEFRKADSEQVTLGSFFHRGHVVGIATNLTKQFITEVEASKFADGIKKQLISALQKYVSRLQSEDLNSANIKDTINQEVYARYIKSPDKYLVEFQTGSENISAGGTANSVVSELRRIFSGVEDSTLKATISKSLIGTVLVESEGSPSHVNLIAQGIADTIAGKPKSKRVYKSNSVKVLSNTIKIIKPEKNSKKVVAANKLITELRKPVNKPKISPGVSIANLESLLRSRLTLQVKENMGTGSATNVLNYRTGRFAESANIERATQSRAGMVTVFYNYMRHPYGTFSEGGKQQFPKSRDPKLLISKSIRQIGAALVGNRMRAVLI